MIPFENKPGTKTDRGIYGIGEARYYRPAYTGQKSKETRLDLLVKRYNYSFINRLTANPSLVWIVRISMPAGRPLRSMAMSPPVRSGDDH